MGGARGGNYVLLMLNKDVENMANLLLIIISHNDLRFEVLKSLNIKETDHRYKDCTCIKLFI